MVLRYDYQSIFVINRNLTKDIFLQMASIEKDGYAKDMFSRMYDNIFSELIDLEYEYQKYYSKEYDCFERFLYRKMYLDDEDIDKIIEIKKENSDYIVYLKKDDYSYGDGGGLMQFAFSETMHERITNILLLKI